VDLSQSSEDEDDRDRAGFNNMRSRSPSQSLVLTDDQNRQHLAKAIVYDKMAACLSEWAETQRQIAAGDVSLIRESRWPSDLIQSIMHHSAALHGSLMYEMQRGGDAISADEARLSVPVQTANVMNEIAKTARSARRATTGKNDPHGVMRIDKRPLSPPQSPSPQPARQSRRTMRSPSTPPVASGSKDVDDRRRRELQRRSRSPMAPSTTPKHPPVQKPKAAIKPVPKPKVADERTVRDKIRDMKVASKEAKEVRQAPKSRGKADDKKEKMSKDAKEEKRSRIEKASDKYKEEREKKDRARSRRSPSSSASPARRAHDKRRSA
jgi:hypothetical protein